ncbi:glycosyltransferase family 4 protein [Sphingosinicella humi]|uniref:Glycosyl transferase family 1 n=1 Tax=Allosphingosinicella humi TaxID=2068657 RepID=A0A2U2J185_9SPHN|nr:glycosyltransferase family 4 protein [Sphingosinicella humi]PWG02098.1 glycosyl transferase family 1 [Sphingosinicella humi]
MRIAHLCLSCFYVDGMSYQENELVREHVRAGHDVEVIASTETMNPREGLIYVEPTRYLGEDGAWVTRLPYRRWLPHKIMRKLRAHPGVYDRLRAFRPDVILFHGACGWELRAAARYVRDHPGVLLYVDSHEDTNNSARGFISREFLHRRFYGPVLRSALPQVSKILAVSIEAVDFVKDIYKAPPDMLEFYPLGGHPLQDVDYYSRRRRMRERLEIGEGQVAIVQSGKQTPRKKLIEALDAFSQVSDPSLRLFIAGALQKSIRAAAEQRFAADDRIRFIGWQDREALTDLLCAADIYLQPGTQSATMQHSLCCRCAVILDDVPAHVPYQRENGWFVSDQAGLVAAMREASSADLISMQTNSRQLAMDMLDYSVLAERILR